MCNIVGLLLLCSLATYCSAFYPHKTFVNHNVVVPLLTSPKLNLYQNGGSLPQQCLCFPRPQQGVAIPDILHGRDQGLERLVVFIYRQTPSNVIKVYVPPADIQTRIQDAYVNKYEELLNPTSITELFHTSSSYVVSYKQKQIIETDSSFNINGNTIPPVDDNIDNNTPNDNNSPIDNNNNDNEQNLPNGLLPTTTDPQPIDDEPTTPISIPDDQSYNNNVVIHNKKINHQHSSDSFTYEECTTQSCHKDTSGNLIKPAFNGISIHPGGATYLFSSISPIAFEKWFEYQIKQFPHHKALLSNLNGNVIKRYIEYSLSQSGLHFSGNGVLKDNNGLEISLSNLKLRPILIGSPIDYGSITNSASKVVGVGEPYLELILITSSHPSRILGVIPVGKVLLHKPSLSSESRYSPTPAYDESRAGSYDLSLSAKVPTLIPKSKITIGDDNQEKDRKAESESESALSPAALLKLLPGFLDLFRPRSSDLSSVEGEGSVERQGIWDQPEYRIIGGTAAIQSGFPLSNKGRSGDATP